MRLYLIKYILPIVAGITLLCSAPIIAQGIPEASKNLVVMVHLQNKGERLAGFGAGIIISQSDKRTVIATANHVIRDELGDFRGEIAVEFNSLRGKLFPANANVFYTDHKLDLALLFVDHLSNPDTPRVLNDELQHSLSPTTIPNLLSANVQIVGFMNENLWAVSHPKDEVVASSINGINVKSADVAVGASGGALMDSFGRILGMITYIDPQPQPTAVALPMNLILDRVSRWKIESQLKLAKAPTASKELQALFDNASRIVVDYLGDIDHPYRFSVSVILPGALAELAPTVNFLISDEANYQQPQALELFPPHYRTEFNCSPDVFKTKISLILPDGRLIGERTDTLDCETKINQMIAKYEVESLKPRSYESLMQTAEVLNKINQYKQFKQNQADRNKKFGELQRKYEMDVREKQKSLRRGLFRPKSPPLQLDCKYRSLNDEIPQWHCDSRFFLVSHVDDEIYSIKLGPSREDLYIDIPVNDSLSPDTHIAEESRKLLSEGKERIYMSIRLVDGTQLETWRICAVINLRYPEKACKR